MSRSLTDAGEGQDLRHSRDGILAGVSIKSSPTALCARSGQSAVVAPTPEATVALSLMVADAVS
jgi:hypothetical protein